MSSLAAPLALSAFMVVLTCAIQILGLAEEVRSGEKATPVAIDEAKAIIDSYTVSDIGTLSTRLGG